MVATDTPPRADREAGDPSALCVYFDGSCPLCRREIAFYRRRRGAERIDWIDVGRPGAGAPAADLSREDALRRFHVRDREGRLRSGGAAFAHLWSELPGFAPWGRLFRTRLLAPVIEAAYALFLPLRPRLQRLFRPR